MNDRPFISQFSPQWTNPEFLEKILVQRHELLRESVELIRESILTGNKHHLLFVGPRGVGKTNLVTLIHHRLSQDVELKEKMRFAWLNEDEVATSFLRLLVLIYRNLSDRYPTEFPASTINGILGQDAKLAQENLATALLRDLAGRTIVLIVENLDTLFRAMPQAELLNWRAFVQNHPVFATLGTAQALFDGISDREEPFFGFFDTRHLEPLTVDEARTLLENLARLNDRKDLLEYLQTPTGKSRVRTIRELSGGNPRLFVIFSELLTTAKDLDDLVRPFEEMVDRQLTSYYQERLRWLSPQQREIIQLLSRSRHPVPVKQIAEGLFTTHNSITGQLKQLREMRYLNFHQNGREVFYELAEPLMRLALQVKETHDRRPLALIVDFLRVVYEREEIEERLAGCDPASRMHTYYSMAISAMEAGVPNPHQEFLRYELNKLPENECDDETLAIVRCSAEELDEPTAWLKLGKILYQRAQWHEAIEILTRVVGMPNCSAAVKAEALFMRGKGHRELEEFEAAMADLSFVIEQGEVTAIQWAKTLCLRARIHVIKGQLDEAKEDFSSVISSPHSPSIEIIYALVNRGNIFAWTGQSEYALRDFRFLLTSCNKDLVYSLSKECGSVVARSLLEALFARGTAYPDQAATIGEFISRFVDYNALPQLGDALVQHLPKLAASQLNHAAWDAWADSWESSWANVRNTLKPEDQDQFEIPLRLLRAGIEYLKTKQENRLLVLPSEERKVLRHALGLPGEKDS